MAYLEACVVQLQTRVEAEEAKARSAGIELDYYQRKSDTLRRTLLRHRGVLGTELQYRNWVFVLSRYYGKWARLVAASKMTATAWRNVEKKALARRAQTLCKTSEGRALARCFAWWSVFARRRRVRREQSRAMLRRTEMGFLPRWYTRWVRWVRRNCQARALVDRTNCKALRRGFTLWRKWAARRRRVVPCLEMAKRRLLIAPYYRLLTYARSRASQRNHLADRRLKETLLRTEGLEQQLCDLWERNACLEAKECQYQRQKRDSEKQLAAATEELEAMSAKMSALQARVQSSAEAKGSLEGQLHIARDQLTAAQTAAAAHQREAREMREKLDATWEKLHISEERGARLSTSVSVMRDELQRAKEERDAREEELREAEARLEAFGGQVDDAKAAGIELTKLRNSCRAQLRRASDVLQTKSEHRLLEHAYHVLQRHKATKAFLRCALHTMRRGAEHTLQVSSFAKWTQWAKRRKQKLARSTALLCLTSTILRARAFLRWRWRTMRGVVPARLADLLAAKASTLLLHRAWSGWRRLSGRAHLNKAMDAIEALELQLQQAADLAVDTASQSGQEEAAAERARLVGTIASLEKQLETTQASAARLREELVEVTEKEATARRAIAEHEQRAADSERKQQDLVALNTTYEKALHVARQQLDEAQAANTTLIEEVARERREIDRLHEAHSLEVMRLERIKEQLELQVAANDEIVESHIAGQHSAEATAEAYKRRHEELEDQLRAANRGMEDLEKSKLSVLRQLAEAEAAVESLKQQLEQKQIGYKEASVDSQRRLEQYKASLDSSNQKVHELEAKLDEKTEALELCRIALREKEIENEKTQAVVDELQEMTRSSSKKMYDLEESVGEHTLRVQELEMQQRDNHSRQAQLVHELEEVNAESLLQAERHRRELEAVERLYHETQEKLETALAQAEEKKQAEEELLGRLEEEEKRCVELMKRLQSASDELALRDATVKRLEQSQSDLERHLKELEGAHEEASELETTIRRLQQEKDHEQREMQARLTLVEREKERRIEEASSRIRELEDATRGLRIAMGRQAEEAAELLTLPTTEREGRGRIQHEEKRARRALHREVESFERPVGEVGYLGIKLKKGDAAVVLEATPGSPAATAGVRKGDIVKQVTTPLGVIPIASRRHFFFAVGPTAHVFQGTVLELLIAREGRGTRTVSVQLAPLLPLVAQSQIQKLSSEGTARFGTAFNARMAFDILNHPSIAKKAVRDVYTSAVGDESCSNEKWLSFLARLHKVLGLPPVDTVVAEELYDDCRPEDETGVTFDDCFDIVQRYLISTLTRRDA